MSEGLMFKGSVGIPLPSKTYMPGKEDIIIKKGYFLSGDQIILGDQSLDPENIVKGETIFGVAGNRTPNNLMIYTGEEEPEAKLGLWIPCPEVEINAIVFAPEYGLKQGVVEDGSYVEGTLVLPISTYNHYQLSEMMPVVYSSAPYIFSKGELIRYPNAMIGDGIKWNPFDISIPIIQGGMINKEFFNRFNRTSFCQTPNYPQGYSDVTAAERNGVLFLYFNQRSSHNVYMTWTGDKLVDLGKYSRMTVKVKSAIEYNIGGRPTSYQSFAGARLGFKTSPSSTVVDNFAAQVDVDPAIEEYVVDISYVKTGYLALQLNAYEYGAITVQISDIILG